MESSSVTMFPTEDSQFEDQVLTKVEPEGPSPNGWSIFYGDCMGFHCPPESPIEPKAGMVARFYGRGLGSRVRGLFIDGRKVFYRTEAEDNRYFEIQLYGEDAAEWLKRWDDGRTVWTIEMGGLGPGYEQCIHITCAEILRVMLAKQYDHSKWSDKDAWKRDRDEIDKAVLEVPAVKSLGLSGAQWGAALNVASHIYMHGPVKMLTDERVKDRHIQVSNNMRFDPRERATA